MSAGVVTELVWSWKGEALGDKLSAWDMQLGGWDCVTGCVTG